MPILSALWRKSMIQLCNTCKGYHKTYDDGFDYLSCMGFLKFGMGKVDLQNTLKSGSKIADTTKKTKMSTKVRVKQKTKDLDTFWNESKNGVKISHSK